MKNYGIQNEYDFVLLFNNKTYTNLDNNSKEFFKDLYGDIVDSNTNINAWKNSVVQKTDVFIKYKGFIKRISLKCGNSNSIHHEQIQEFNLFLKKLGVPYKFINYYLNYHFGYKRNGDKTINYDIKLTSEEYKKFYQNEIDCFNKEINKTKIIIDMVDRFLIRGKNSDYDIDALVYGTANNYVWLKKYDIYDLILYMRNKEYTSPHVSCLTIGPKKRNIDGKSNNWKEKYIVCIRWNFIKENIIEYKKKYRG